MQGIEKNASPHTYLLLSIASVTQFAMMTTSINRSNGLHEMLTIQNFRTGLSFRKQNKDHGALSCATS